MSDSVFSLLYPIHTFPTVPQTMSETEKDYPTTTKRPGSHTQCDGSGKQWTQKRLTIPRQQVGEDVYLSRSHAMSAANLLDEVAELRREELGKYSVVRMNRDSDEEVDSNYPIYDEFFSSGRDETIVCTKRFSSSGFHSIWNRLEGHFATNWSAGWGPRSKYSAKDVFFMTLATMKHGGTWDWMEWMFEIKAPTSERLTTHLIEIIYDSLYENVFTK